MNFPIYMKDDKTVKPGMYLALFHGYKNEKERAEKEEFGANGPLIGPLTFCHTTYAAHIKLHFETDEDAKLYGYYMGKDAFNEILINKEGCAEFQGMEYGDWAVANFPSKE